MSELALMNRRLMNSGLNRKVLSPAPQEKNLVNETWEELNRYVEKGYIPNFLLCRDRFFRIQVDRLLAESKSRSVQNKLVSIQKLLANEKNDDEIYRFLSQLSSGYGAEKVSSSEESARMVPIESFRVPLGEKINIHGTAGKVVDDIEKFYTRRLRFPEMPCYKNHKQYILLAGPSGTGKTTVAKALAQRMEADFIAVDAAQIRSSGYGESAARMQSIFKQAGELCKESEKKVLLFIDEVDHLVPSRAKNPHEASVALMAEILQFMDGVQSLQFGTDRLIMLFATNREEDIDTAFKTRVKMVNIPLPDFSVRCGIVKSLLKTAPQHCAVDDSDIEKAVRTTEPEFCSRNGKLYAFTGRDLERAVVRASDLAVERFLKGDSAISSRIRLIGKNDRPQICLDDLLQAFSEESRRLSETIGQK